MAVFSEMMDEATELRNENSRLRDTIEVMRAALEAARPYVSEQVTFSNSSNRSRGVLDQIDQACGIYK